MSVDIDDNTLCRLHFNVAITERGELDLHIVAVKAERHGVVWSVPQCMQWGCEADAFVRVWPVKRTDPRDSEPPTR